MVVVFGGVIGTAKMLINSIRSVVCGDIRHIKYSSFDG